LKAADQVHAGAQYQLGLTSVIGVGLPQANQKAMDWFLKAADQG